ncbi:helix-turn-helix domain-containing protein [Kutzneria sp. NPDC052558]|uniref:helix-turn-helix domain-containing protein n=1 Tax=Kutzneria sp. NPDC052558 TaxID=3364121 RepID=UPI0037CAE34E
MQLRYNYRVYPTLGQQGALARAFGCARVVFNDGLRIRQEARTEGLPHISDGELSKRVITHAKTRPERAWLGEVSAVVLQQALADLNAAYHDFFASISGNRAGRTVAPPRFRSREDNRQAIRFTRDARFVVLDNGSLRLPKIGDVPCSRCERLDGPKPLSVRSWTCRCGAVHDRDVNAARNVLARGHRESRNDRGAQVRPASVLAPRGEAVTHPDTARPKGIFVR